MKPLEAIRRHGTPDENGRLGLYFTMSATPNSTGLFLHFTEVTVAVRHIDGHTVAEWQLEEIAKQFTRKFPAMILVSAFSEKRGDIEWFHYSRAQLLTGISPEILHYQMREGNITIDLRLHDKGTSARNHGTGFRVREDKLQLLFKTVNEL